MKNIFGLKNTSLSIPLLQPALFKYTGEDNTIIVFPTLHNQLGFSKLVNDFIEKTKIDKILVELPGELSDLLEKAINRLPICTVLHQDNMEFKEEEISTQFSSQAYIIHPGDAIYWASFLGFKKDIRVSFIDALIEDNEDILQINLDYYLLSYIGWKQFWQLNDSVVKQHFNDKMHLSRSVNMANKILKEAAKNTLVVIGAAHWPIIDWYLKNSGYNSEFDFDRNISDIVENQINKIKSKKYDSVIKWKLADIHPHSLFLVFGDLPFFINDFISNPISFDILESIRKLYFNAEIIYKDKFDDSISPASYRKLFQYLRNLARLRIEIIPNLYDLLVSAKGMVDDDYAFEVYKLAIQYEFIPSEGNKMDHMIKFVPNKEQMNTVKFAFRRRFKRPIVRFIKRESYWDDIDPIPEEEYPGQWAEIWNKASEQGYVSYPPEDVYLEKYLHYLRKRISNIIAEEQASTMKFDTSIEDGIDWKETIRNFHKKEIYVKKLPHNVPEVGALIVQFLEEYEITEEYSHYTLLFAEHEKESHLSIVSTEPGEILVGPGISRLKYAAIISQYPPVSWPALIPNTNDDWKIRLIYTAMRMSLTKIIGYVGPSPPSAAHRYFASSNGYRLVYLPMQSLTKTSWNRLRTLHLLADRSLRDRARDYIGF